MGNRSSIDNYTNEFAKSFGQQLKAKRTEINMSGNVLAKECLVSRRWIQKIENGSKLPSIYILASISKALDFYEWEFFTLRRF